MKIILRDDIEGLGTCGDIVTVKDGYARNYLMPRKLAIAATKGNLRAISQVTTQKDLRDRKRRRASDKLKDALERLSCTAKVQVGEEDRMFGSVTSQMIADMLLEQGFEIDRRIIQLEEPIKALGVYTVPVKVDKDVTAQVKVWVVKED